MSSLTITSSAAIAIATALAHPTHAFVTSQKATMPTIDALFLPMAAKPHCCPSSHLATLTALFMSTETAETTESALSLTLEKPLGLILEESDDGTGGVIVTQVNEGGSAFDSPSAELLVNSKISAVMERDVSSLGFDEVMDAIVDAPSPLDIEFALPPAAAAVESETTDEAESTTPAYEVGTLVSITVQQPPETNKPDIVLNGRVGDNLRKTLLSNGDIELYRGLKKKLGNCGGGGQCGFCAVELTDDEGVWGERSDYEAQKIGRNGSEKCRLACMNNIVGPATVRTL